MRRVNRFQRNFAGKSTYTCRRCQKLTRETGACESGCELCFDCFTISSYENSHSDNDHAGRFADCADCKRYVEGEGVKHPTTDSWCDNDKAPSESYLISHPC